MNKNTFFLLLLLSLGVRNTNYAQACLGMNNSSQGQGASANCTNCNAFNHYMDYLSDSTDTVVIVKINWVYTRPSTGPGVYKYCDTPDASASIYSSGPGLNDMFDQLLQPVYTTNPPAPFVKYPRIKFVLNSYKFVTDDALYYGPNMPDNATSAQPFCVPPPSYLNSDDGITIILNVDTNTYVNNGVRVPNGGYGVAGGIGAKYLNMRLYTDTPSCLVNPNHQHSYWWANTDIILHELGHCFGLVHSNSYMNCVDDYFLEGSGTWGGGNNVMGYHYTQRHYLSPEQLAKCHYELVNLLYGQLVNNQYFTVNHNHDVNITSNTTWAYERHMKGNVIVKAGNTLTVQCRVSMLQDAKFIVEKGAKLIVDGGEITNVMGRLWRGIEIVGTPGAAHLISNQTGYCSTQGIVEIKNNAIISNAWFGVYTGRTNDATMALTPNTGGGIVMAENSSFINNVFDVFLYDHPAGVNRSKLTRCSFLTTSALNKDKDASTIPTPHEHVKLYKYTGMQVLGCKFIYSAGSAYTSTNRGAGIYSTDAPLTVDHVCSNTSNPCTSYIRNEFRDLHVGVWVDNFNPSYVVSVYNSDFYTQTGWSAIAHNSYYLNFMKNYITGAKGLYLNRSKYYKVRLNNFDGISHGGTGIAVNESQTGFHEIYANNIFDWGYGINVQHNNGNSSNGLKMNCNDFTADYNQYDIVMTTSNSNNPPTVFAQQSPANVTPQPGNLVRNLYGAPYINSSFLNKWWVHSSNQQIILHACNSSPASTNPTPQASSQVWVLPQSNMPLNYQNDCTPNPSSTGGTWTSREDRLGNLNSYLSDMKADNQEGQNHFEIGATVSTKLGIYLSDTVPGDIDSAIAILARNEGEMDDADIMLIFAYMKKGDYTMAEDKISSLSSNRADWQDFLQFAVDIEQRDNGMYSLLDDADEAETMEDYANTDGGDGQAAAQAIMKLVFGVDHSLQLNYPDEDGVPPPPGGGEDDKDKTSGLNCCADAYDGISIFPNPTSSGFTLKTIDQDRSALSVEISDYQGRIVYSGDLNGKESHFISMEGWNNGIYFISVLKKDLGIVYRHSIIKQD